jgi:serine/threonine protein phosphatase PrpC
MAVQFLRQDALLIECFEAQHFRVAVAMKASPDHGEENQDSCLVHEDSAGNVVMAVADGFGGAPRGAEASRLSLKAFAASCTGKSLSVAAQVIEAFDRANEAVRELRCGAATTLFTAWCNTESQVRICHAGDSFALVLGRGGRVKYQALQHSPGGYAEQAGISKKSIASELAGEEQLVLNFVGSHQMSVDVGPALELSRYDTIVLASDGLSDNLSLDEILEYSRIGAVEQCAASLLSAAVSRIESGSADSKPDDVTVMVCRKRGEEERE